jgi:uncharacterized membrane protein
LFEQTNLWEVLLKEKLPLQTGHAANRRNFLNDASRVFSNLDLLEFVSNYKLQRSKLWLDSIRPLLILIENKFFFWLVASRLTATLLLAAIAVLTRRPLVPPNPPLGLIMASGVLDVSGNFLFLRAVQTGRLDIASVLVSLYPAITVLWATFVAKERITRLQTLGVAVAVFAIALITV